jgi:curli biogenesis system outer membrane secretion channel CsgG
MKKLLACAALAALFGCAPKVTTSVLMPSKTDGISSLRNVAVLPFSGSYGTQLTPSAENVLVTAEVKGVRYFKVADRQNLNRVISEQKLQVSGITDESTAVKLGRLVGVQGIFTGTAESSVSSSNYVETRTKCAGSDSKGKCTSFYDYTVVCTKKKAAIVFFPKLIDVSTAQVVYSDKITGESEDDRCQDSGIALLSDYELLKSAVNSAMNEFRTQVAPYSTNVKLTLLTEKDGLDGDGKDLLKSAQKFAEANRMDRACAMWQEGAAKYPESPSFLYNLGLCRETEAKYEEALELYMKADAQTDKPDKIIGAAIIRAKQRIADTDRLKKQL